MRGILSGLRCPIGGATLLVSLSWCLPAQAGTPEPALEPMLPGPGPNRAMADGVTYELVQYEPNTAGLSSRLVELPTAQGGPSPVYAVPGNYRKKVIGWVFVEQLTDGSRMQRWLLLHEMLMASVRDIEMTPASYMGGTFTAPSTVAGFTARAQAIFDAAKLSSPDPPRDKTRYVKVHSGAFTLLDHIDDVPANNSVADPSAPTPAGNGYWDGIPPVQLDGGTIAMYKKGTTTNAVVGLMQESNSGYAGTESWFLDDDYLEPTELQPIIFATQNYMTGGGIGTVADLSEVITANPPATQREWNLLRESATYYSETFPSSSP